MGSSLSSCVTLLVSSAWLSTNVPSVMAGASSMSNWISISLSAGRLRLRISSTPAPFVPPLGSVFVVSAPGGMAPCTSASVPGSKTGDAFSTPRSS